MTLREVISLHEEQPIKGLSLSPDSMLNLLFRLLNDLLTLWVIYTRLNKCWVAISIHPVRLHSVHNKSFVLSYCNLSWAGVLRWPLLHSFEAGSWDCLTQILILMIKISPYALFNTQLYALWYVEFQFQSIFFIM